MGFFDFLRQPDVNQGVKEYKDTTGAVLLAVLPPAEWIASKTQNVRRAICIGGHRLFFA